MVTSKIEQLTRDHLNIKPKAKEERQDYFARIVDAADGLEDDKWEELPKDVQKWINVATKAASSDKEIPEFPDLEDQEEESDERTSSDNEEQEEDSARGKSRSRSARDEDAEKEPDEKEKTVTTKKKTTAKKASREDEPEKTTKKAATKAAKVPKTMKTRTPGKIPAGAPTVIRQMLLKKPNLSKEDIAEKLKEKGFKLSPLTISTVRSDFRTTIRIIQDSGVDVQNLELQ